MPTTRILSIWALLREARDEELDALIGCGGLDVHARVGLRGGGVAVVCDAFVDITVDGTPERLPLGSTVPVVVLGDEAPQWRLAHIAEERMHPSEVGQLLGVSGIRVPLWDIIAAPRRIELSDGLATWLASTSDARRS